MAGSSLVACTASFPDTSYAQLQLLAPPEATAACLASPSHSRRLSRARTMAKPFFGKEESSHSGYKPCACVHDTLTPAPWSEQCEGCANVMQNSHSVGKRKNQRRSPIVWAAANTTLDRCSSDADNVVSSTESHWQEETFSFLQRSLLESQWALQSAESHLCKDESSSFEDSAATSSKEYMTLSEHSQQMGSSVVRSGQASARRRRLTARSRAAAMGRCSGIDSCKASEFFVKTNRSQLKHDPARNFVTSFLKRTNGCSMLSKDQEKGFTKQMRICQSLEKVKRRLKKKLGYDPSYELWAQSVSMSTEELLSMVREGEIARNLMVSSHLRLVVSVARAYQNVGVDMADLVLEGTKGLLRGLEKFDYRKGCKISTYVHWWIRQGVTRAIADHSRLVRLPVYLHEISFQVSGAKKALILEGKPVTLENLSSMLNIPSDKIIRALRAESKVFSLDKSGDSDGLKMEFNGLHEFIADSTGDNDPWCLCNEENIIGIVRDLLTLLTSREQDIIRWVFGIDTEGGVRSSLTSIGIKLGLSKERARQIKIRALSKMQPNVSDGNRPFLVDIQDQF